MIELTEEERAVLSTLRRHAYKHPSYFDHEDGGPDVELVVEGILARDAGSRGKVAVDLQGLQEFRDCILRGVDFAADLPADGYTTNAILAGFDYYFGDAIAEAEAALKEGE